METTIKALIKVSETVGIPRVLLSMSEEDGELEDDEDIDDDDFEPSDEDDDE